MKRRALAIAVAVAVPLLVIAGVVTFGGGSSGRRKLPLAVGTKTAQGTADAAASAIAPYGEVRYEAGPDLPALTGDAAAHRLTGSVDEAKVQQIAGTFGLNGAVQGDGAGGFTLTDGTARLSVQPQGAAWFSYDSGRGYPVSSGVATCVAPSAPADSTSTDAKPPVTDCQPVTTTVPQHPAGFPSEDEAKAKALDALRAAGVAVDGAKVEASDNGTAWQVQVTQSVDGIAVPGLGGAASVDDKGIAYAGGTLGRVERFDTYPLIGTTAAIQHLNDHTDPWGLGLAIPTVCPSGADCAVDLATGGGSADSRGSSAASGPCTVTTIQRADGSKILGCTDEAPDTPTVTADCGADCTPTTELPQTNRACLAINAPYCPPAPSPPCPDGSAPSIHTDEVGVGLVGCWGTASVPPSDPNECVAAPCDAGTASGSTGSASASSASAGPGTIVCPDIATLGSDGIASPVPCPSEPPTTIVPTEPTVVTLTGATLGLELVPSGTSDAYLVPVYLFTTADGQGPAALAIDGSWIEPPAIVPAESTGSSASGSEGSSGSIEPAPAPVEPPTTCGPPVESVPADATPPDASASSGAATKTAPGCPIN